MKYILYTFGIVIALGLILIGLSELGGVAVIAGFVVIMVVGYFIYKEITKDTCNLRNKKKEGRL